MKKPYLLFFSLLMPFVLHAEVLSNMKAKLKAKLTEIDENDLPSKK